MAQAVSPLPSKDKAGSLTRLSEASQKSLVKYVDSALQQHKRRTDMHQKMAMIDVAYARYTESTMFGTEADGTTGVDLAAGNVQCGVALKNITVPIVVSQVDSFVGYLADVFLSGYPIFPVVSSPANRKDAEKLQSIIDTHAIVGAYPRQLLKFIRDGIKYNFSGLEVDWAPIDRYSITTNIMKPLDAAGAKKSTEAYNKIKRIDPYNLITDPRIEDMADNPYCGEFGGYVELLSRVELTRTLQRLIDTDYGYNTTSSLHTDLGKDGKSPLPGYTGIYYKEKPQISELIQSKNFNNYGDFDWERWMNSQPSRAGRPVKGLYEVTTLYARIIPSDHEMSGPNRNIPQIWKLRTVNNDKLIHAQRIISAYDLLPILIGQPLEDGFAEQTQSVGEMQIPMQEAVSTLYNIRFNAARRAVSDRGIYDPKILDSSDVNSAAPAAKIPIKPNSLLGGKTLEHAYRSIPFDPRGTDNVIQDAREVMAMSGMLTGLNKPQQGEFQKGNKSVQEWSDTMAGSDNRLRLPALCLEYQVFLPLKEQLKLNIYQYGPTGIFQDLKNGQTVEVAQEDIEKLRKVVLFFKIADGYIPASKLASTQTIMTIMQLISQSQILQASYGPMLPEIVAHLAQLGGVLGLEEYLPQLQPQGAPAAQDPTALLAAQAAPGAAPTV